MSFESELGSISKDNFRKTANKLLNHCYLLKKRDDTRLDYQYIKQYQDKFSEYFDLLGYSLQIDDTNGVIGLHNNLDKSCRIKLRKYHSILLLILRLLYAKSKNTLSLNEEVVITLEQVHNEYYVLRVKNRPTLDKTTLQEALNMFQKYNIIDKLDSDISNPDMRIKIYPSILFAVPTDSLNKVFNDTSEKLKKYARGNISDEEN